MAAGGEVLRMQGRERTADPAMNLFIVTGCLLTAALTLVIAQDPDLWPMPLVLTTLLLLQVTGQILILVGRARPGAWLVLLSSFLIIPLGLAGVMGARQVLDRKARADFERA